MGEKSRTRTRDNNEVFVGLYNQGATCNLNTLLQTLYMTPEVKETIISFIEKTNEKIHQDTSICYQLKELFARLDAKQVTNTCGITRNLGMSQQEIFKQQDIEEYFRRLLNKVATESDGSCNILQIYQSKVINSLKCLVCNIEAPEECILLDIPLPIQSFGSPIHFQSVNESFQEFLKVDTFNGDNMCYCETCQKKTETETRYYFKSLPQILALQLKRFEFDYFKMSFTKLQHDIEIPPTLTFQKKKNKDIEKTEWCLISMESKEAKKTELKKRPSFSLGPQPSKRSRNDESEGSQKLLKDESQQDAQEHEGPLQSNKHAKNDCSESHEPRKDDSQQSYTTYELFAICNHSGGYGSGYYDACIKPVSSSKWYCFNDTDVAEMKDFFGARHGSTVSISGMPCKRSSTANMLMYRKEEINSNQGDNADEEKEVNQPMTKRDQNRSPELGGMGDGEDNCDLEQSSQPLDQNLEDPPEKNSSEAKEGKETTGGTENRKCGMKERERQTQETDVVKEGGMVMKEKSSETDEMVATEQAQCEPCQIGSKENVMREKENVGHLQDSEGKTVENVTGDNANEEKEVNQPMTKRDENRSPELGGMGDGEDNCDLEQSSQPLDQNLEDPPEKNSSEAKEGKETTGGTENRKCGMKERERQTQETDVVKEGGMVMKGKSSETDEMVTTEKAQREQCQIGSKENVMREKENVGHLQDSEGKTVENVTGDNANEEKEVNQPMTKRNENRSPELGGMGDGEDNCDLEQSSQPLDQNLEHPPEKNSSEAKEGKETTGGTENRKCGMKERERQTQETDVVKEGGMVMKEKSSETDEMVATEKAQCEPCQIGSKENVIREKENVGHLQDCEGKTVENVTGTEKEKRNAAQIKSVTDKNTPNFDESEPENNDNLKEELMENKADKTNIKGEKETEKKNLSVKTEDKNREQERKLTIRQKEPELEEEEQNRMEQTSQSQGLQHVKGVEKTAIKQRKGCKEQIVTAQNEHHSKKEEKEIRGENKHQEEEKTSLFVETTKEEGRREQTSKKNVQWGSKKKKKSEDLQENRIENLPMTENREAAIGTKTPCFFNLNWFRKTKKSPQKTKSKAGCFNLNRFRKGKILKKSQTCF